MRIIKPKPRALWWLVLAIYTYALGAGLLETLYFVEWQAVLWAAGLVAPVGMLGFILQRRLLWRWFWIGYLVAMLAWVLGGPVASLIAAPVKRGLQGWLMVAPELLLLVGLYAGPLAFALWAYAFRSPHIWHDEPGIVA